MPQQFNLTTFEELNESDSDSDETDENSIVDDDDEIEPVSGSILVIDNENISEPVTKYELDSSSEVSNTDDEEEDDDDLKDGKMVISSDEPRCDIELNFEDLGDIEERNVDISENVCLATIETIEICIDEAIPESLEKESEKESSVSESESLVSEKESLLPESESLVSEKESLASEKESLSKDNYRKKSIQELKALAISKGLVTDASKMKKAELQQLLGI